MQLDTKQQVLIAIYTEYQKELPNMKQAITANNLGIENAEVFYVALDKLQNEGFISDVRIIRGDKSPMPVKVLTSFMKMTRNGLDYVEKLLEIDKTLNGEDKTRNVIKKATDWGFEQLKDFAAKVLAEIIKNT